VSAAALLANLPEETRKKYPTPESLASVFLASSLVDASSLQILGQNATDATHVSVRVQIYENGRAHEAALPLQLGPGGWQMAVSEQQIEKIARRLKAPVSPSGP
jgi:hypothetical protein